MSHAKNNTSLYLLRNAYEAKKRQRSEKVLGAIIGISLMALGAWGMWEHNFFLTFLFLIVLGWDLVKTFQEKTLRLLTLSYTILLVIGLYFHVTEPAVIGGVLFGVATLLHLTKK